MATAKGSEYDKIQSLDLGADDYLVKPFGVMEMVSRVKAVLRRYKPSKESKALKAGELHESAAFAEQFAQYRAQYKFPEEN